MRLFQCNSDSVMGVNFKDITKSDKISIAVAKDTINNLLSISESKSIGRRRYLGYRSYGFKSHLSDHYGKVAQQVEQRTENPRVGSSTLPLSTNMAAYFNGRMQIS